MKDQLTATIIPFPVRAKLAQVQGMEAAPTPVAPVLSAPATPPSRKQVNDLSQSSQRLTQALANLSVALADQRDATQRWKAAIEDLAVKMRSLGEVGAVQKKLG